MRTAIKAIPISAYPESAWRLVLGVGDWTEASGVTAYRRVAVIYRGVKVRAKSVRAMPLALYRGSRDVSETPDGIMELRRVRTLLGLGAASLVLYAAAYGLREAGRLTGGQYIRWVSSSAMKPKTSKEAGLEGITRTIGGEEKVLPLDRVWYAWHQNPQTDVGPDVAPVDVAAAAAGVLGSLNELKEAYFRGGAIRPTLIPVPPGTGEPERKKLQTWYERLRGKKNAFGVQVVGADVKTPVTIGDNLKDVLPEGVEDDATMEALIALEVPASLVLPDAANYATAKQDALNFLEHVTLPDAQLLIDALNEQHYGAQGLEIRALPERLEVRQAAELEKAQAVMGLAGVAVLTQSEARQRLDLEPLGTDAEEAERLEVQAKLQIMQAARDAGYNAAQAATLAGLPPPDEEAPPPPPPPALLPPPPADMGDMEDMGEGEEHEAEAMPTRAIAAHRQAVLDTMGVYEPRRDPGHADMLRWREKALRRLGRGQKAWCSFESRWIDPHDAEIIAHRLEHATTTGAVRAAFALKAPGAGLSAPERALFTALRDILEAQAPEVLRAIMAGQVVDLSALPGLLQAAIVPALTSTALDVAGALAEAIGPDFDPAELTTTAAEWALEHAGELVKGITDTTRQLVQSATSAYMATPGMERADLETLLRAAFSPRRAETIAITEITRAASAATTVYQERLAAAGLAFVKVWNTVNAEDVCELCDPLNGKTEPEWADRYPGGPPAHPRCRCATSLRSVKT